MCTVKTPKPQPVEKKDPVYMRNPWLDGLGIGAESRGRNSLRIERGTPVARPRPAGRSGSGLGHNGLALSRYGGGPVSGITNGFAGRGLTIGTHAP